jgi:hypothetical protein
VSSEDYRAALATAIEEYEALGAQRREIDTRLAQLSQTIATLSRLLGLRPTVPLGLTDAVRLVMRGAGVPMTPLDVRERLRAIGFDLSKYGNDLAAVHTVLRRLNDAGELRWVARGPRRNQYTVNRLAGIVALGPDIARFMRDNALEREARSATQEHRFLAHAARPRRPRRAAR